jgi:four helix bundle protein
VVKRRHIPEKAHPRFVEGKGLQMASRCFSGRKNRPTPAPNRNLAPTCASSTLPSINTTFDHEKLTVYQEAIGFVAWADSVLETLPKNLAVHSQLDRASTSIPLNIVEGNGKYTAPDRCRFFDIARGPALECAACLDVLVAKKRLAQADQGKAILIRVVSMLIGLIRSTSSDRVHEDREAYGVERGESAEQDRD